jgi:acetyl esterase
MRREQASTPGRAPRALDPDVQAMLALFESAGHPALHDLSPQDGRAAYAKSWRATQSRPVDVACVHDRMVEGPAGPLSLRVYRPADVEEGQVLPVVLFIHGGGWMIGNLDSHDPMCRRLANGARAVVVAVDYRLAPEHPFPAAVDDCARALRWLVEAHEALCIDPSAIAVAGDSAGGNLAAVLSLMARDGALPTVAHQALFYPVTDIAGESPSYGLTRASLPLTAHTMRYFIGHYAPQSGDRLDWRASPLRAPSVEGVAPALVLTVGHDPLRDEGQAYARRLDEAGVRVCAVHLNDQVHGLFGLGRLLPAADRILDAMASHIGSELRRAGN